MRAGRRAWERGLLAALVVGTLSACDLGGPGGPTRIAGTITGNPALGAAVIDIAWEGVTGFQGRGDTQVYSGAVAGAAGRHRVILVDAVGGDLTFTIDLEDDRLNGPVVSIVSAVGTDNLPVPVADLRVLLAR